ncbi:MAG: caspase family protein [Patescibacteria group bacterium]
MKKIFIILVIGGVVLGLVGISQAKPTYQPTKPIPANDIHIVKKIPVSDEITKGKPTSPSGGGKVYSGAATGVLGAGATGNKYAVVIGICDYPGTDYDLCTSDGDSYNMYNTLRLYGYDPANIYWYRDMGYDPNNYGVDGAPTRQNIINAIESIKAGATANDEVVFFFSGHGADGKIDDVGSEDIDEAIVVHDDDGRIDADGSADLDLIWDEELRILFSGFLTSRIVFVFDSCLAGGMNDVAGTGRVVAMATEETKSAYVYSTGVLGEGVFSHYFVKEGMFQGLADGTNALKASDGTVAVEEAFDYAKTHIPSYLKSRQKPIVSDNFTNDLPL